MLQKTGAFDRWKRVSPPAQSSPMPFSEFHPAGRTTKLEPPHSKAPNFSPPDLPSTMTDSDFVELLWEKGQIVMQGQSSRPPKKSPHSSTFPAYSSRTMNDKGETNSDNIDVMNPRIGRPGPAIDPPGRDFAPVVIPNPVALSAQEDDVSPFLNYPIDDYYSELLSEFSGVNPNPFPGYCSNLTTPLVVKGATTTNGNPLGPGSEVVRDPYNMERLPSTGRARPGRSANQFVQQWQNSAQNNKSKPLEFGGAGSGVVFSLQSMSSDLPKAPPRQDVVTSPKPPVQPPTPSLNTGVINFSHFSRAAFLKDNLQNANRMLNNNSNDKVSVVTNSMDSTLIDSPTCLRSTMQENFSSTSCKPELTPPASQPSWKFALGTGRSEPVKWRDGIGNDNADGSGNASDGIRLPESMQVQMMGSVSTAMPSPVLVEKVPESVMAPSSVCSGNGIAAESGEPLHRAKRKATEEESSYQSEDIEDESIGAKKQPPTRVTTSKRSRAAEVHNLSERRRRDRINEKMRALQELIPNCNKVDKASMLDEAIEYLKTLQLQVQIMSMGGGFCMPPMMLPPAMHRIHPPHMAHFPPVGVGVGYGMGMLDMNGNPMYPLPPVPNPQFPCPSMGAAASSLHSMPPATTTGLPMFGIPSPGIPVTMHRPPSFIPHIAHLAWPNGSPDATTSAAGPTRISVVDPAGSKDLQEQNIGSETSPRQGDPQAMTSTQPMKESIKHCSPSATNDQVSNSGDPANSSSGNGNSSSGASEQHDYY